VRIVGKLIVASALMLLAALPARAEGSLGLDEVLTAVAAAPPLVAESKAELDKDSLKVDGVICTAVRHANHWTLVNAKSAIARFALRPTGSILTPRGKSLGDAGKADPKRAKSFREDNFRSTWTP
jgi:hypothetical protein